MPLAVRGMRELQAALALADKQVRLGVRQQMRESAEPVRRTAEVYADSRIRKMGPPWSVMRVGVTRTRVYVAPRQRGVKRGDPASRPNVAPLLMARAMEPALQQNEPEVRRNFERMLDRLASDFNH